jgi:two-component sensor histidine kinase
MSQPPSDVLQRELAAASPDLVGNSDLLRAVLSGSGDCIKILDLEGRLQFMSEGGKRVMEVDDFVLLKGCPWPAFWAGEGNTQATAALDAARAGKSARFRGPADTAKGSPRYWDVQVSPIFGPDGRPSHLLSISKDITDEWEITQRERFLTEELEHRAKNTFAMVISIANQTFRGEAHASPLQAHNARILALAKAHDMAKGSRLGNLRIRDVVDTAIASHHAVGRFNVSGPELNVAPRQALSLALALNELVTNAAKYGALSAGDGKVVIAWSASQGEEPTFVFRWQEQGGPPVAPPVREGFGTRLIKDFTASDFQGVVSLSYEPTGLVCELRTPLHNLPA